jgi:hypothetical protein
MLGSLVLLYAVVLLFICANLTLGITFSSIAQNQLQAMQMTFFFFLPSILLSGFMFPFRGMPLWAQVIGNCLPLTHFLQLVRGIMLKGNGLDLMLHHIWPLLLFIVVVLGVGLKTFRRTLDSGFKVVGAPWGKRGRRWGSSGAAVTLPDIDRAYFPLSIQIQRNQTCDQPQAADRGDPEAGRAACRAQGVGQPDQEAAAKTCPPQQDRIDQHGHHRFLVAAQGIDGHGLQRVAQMVERNQRDQRDGRRLHLRVGAVEGGNQRRAQPEEQADDSANRHAEADGHPAGVAGALVLAGADGLAGQHGGGIAQRKRDHEGEGREATAIWWRLTRRPRRADKQRHEGEGGDVG